MSCRNCTDHIDIIDVGKRGKGQTPGSARDLPDAILESAKRWADYHLGFTFSGQAGQTKFQSPSFSVRTRYKTSFVSSQTLLGLVRTRLIFAISLSLAAIWHETGEVAPLRP